MRFADRVMAMNRDTLVTGQLFFRYQGSAMELDMSHRHLYGVCGMVALPEGCFVKTEHQYVLAGFDSETEGGILIGIDSEGSVDLTERARGDTIGGILLQPVWKI